MVVLLDLLQKVDVENKEVQKVSIQERLKDLYVVPTMVKDDDSLDEDFCVEKM